MAALDLDVIHRLATLALKHDEPYLAARLIPILSAHQPVRAEWVTGYLRVLARLGLKAAAAALIDRLAEPARSTAEVAALRQCVARGPSGLIPWSSRRRRFEANLACWVKRAPRMAERVREEGVPGLATLELHQCADGNVQIWDGGGGQGAGVEPGSPRSAEPSWWPSLDDHRALAAGRVGAVPAGVIPPAFLFDGVGLGWEILDAHQRTSRVFLEASSSIYVVEPRPVAMAVVLHVHDWRALIADPRVTFFVGPDAAAEFAAFLAADPARPIAGRVLGLSVAGKGTDAAQRMAQVFSARRREAAELRRRLDHTYAGRDAGYWTRRFAEAAGTEAPEAATQAAPATPLWHRPPAGAESPQGKENSNNSGAGACAASAETASAAAASPDDEGAGTVGQDDAGRRPLANRPLRVLGITSIHTTFLQYSMRDCLRALERLGHETRLLIEPKPYLALDPVAAMREQLAFEPDLILVLSRMRDEMTALAHAAIPSVCWDQDALPWVFNPARRPTLAWNDFLMGFSAATAPRRFGWPGHRCLYCPMAASSDAYDPQPLPDSELARYRCDVSYVSHASATPEAEAEVVAGWLPDERLRRIFRAAVERLLPNWLRGGEFPGLVMRAVFDAAAEVAEPPPSWADLLKLIPACQRIGDRAFRHVALGWAADWADRNARSFHIWGNGWDQHPRLSRFARGAARNGHELRCIYQASSVNLQLMGFGFLHQRALDGLMAGGFFLARRSRSDAAAPQRGLLLSLLERHGVSDASQLAGLSSESARRSIVQLIEAIDADPRGLCPQWIEVQHMATQDRYAADVIPHFDEIAFGDATELGQRLERFLAAPRDRRRLAGRMRQLLIEQYSYKARMARMLTFVRDGFIRQAEPAETAEGEWSGVDPQPAIKVPQTCH